MGRLDLVWFCMVVAVSTCAVLVASCTNMPSDDVGLGVSRPATFGLGQVTGHVPPSVDGLRSVVTLDPHVSIDVPVPSELAVMNQYGRDFIPRFLVVREGQTVQFRNSEDELHTVKLSDATGQVIFNIGMPILGGTYEHTFEQAGQYGVGCDSHQEMVARIVVVSSPYAVIADRNGAFSFSDIPVGSYTATVRQRSDQLEWAVDIEAGANTLILDR